MSRRRSASRCSGRSASIAGVGPAQRLGRSRRRARPPRSAARRTASTSASLIAIRARRCAPASRAALAAQMLERPGDRERALPRADVVGDGLAGDRLLRPRCPARRPGSGTRGPACARTRRTRRPSRRPRRRRSRRSPSTRRAAPPSCRRSSPRTRPASRDRASRSRCRAYWPSHSATHASFSVRDASSTRSGGTPASAMRSSVRCASTNMPSPALIACGTPATRQSVSRPWRVSLASSMSSWISVKLCSSSIAAAAGIACAHVAADRLAAQQAERRPQHLAARRLGRRCRPRPPSRGGSA